MSGRRKVSGHIQKGGRSLMVQRSFKKLGIARMYRSSGTTNKTMFAGINNMLTALAEDGTPESVMLLHKLQRGEVSFLQALPDWQRRGTSGVLHLAEEESPIDEANCIEWLTGAYPNANTRTGYLKNYRAMMKHAKPGDAMTDLPEVLARYRRWCVEEGKNYRAFDYGLAVAQAWVRTALGDESETYRRLRKVERFDRKPDPRTKRYWSPREITNLVDGLPDELGAMVWSMAVYGCSPKEYMQDGWRIEGKALHIFGAKTAHRDRKVPLLPQYPPQPVALDCYKQLYRWIKKAKPDMTPNAMRNAYPRWLSASGVPYNRVQMYQGHAETSQTDTYAFHDTEKLLEADAAKLQQWIAEELERETALQEAPLVKVGRARGRSRPRRTYTDDTTVSEVRGKPIQKSRCGVRA